MSTVTKKLPSLPTFYFASDRQKRESKENVDAVGNHNESLFKGLPDELVKTCLVDYADWGDLAKLACVQKEWSTLLTDAASAGGKWELAQAMMEGSHGMASNPSAALALCHELAGVEITHEPLNVAVAVAADVSSVEEEEEEAEFELPEQNRHADVVENDSGDTGADAPPPVEEVGGESLENDRHAPHERENGSNDDENLRLIARKTGTPFAPAMKAIAAYCLEGNGVEADTRTGLLWLKAAHVVGDDVDAAHQLALIYEYGRHNVDVDVYLAARYFLKAALGGHVDAMAEYAMCCELGCGTDQSDELALDWYMKAANAGHVTAKYSVGEAFEEARGVPQSDEEACLWYYKAAMCGDEDSKRALLRLRDIARIVLPGVARLLAV